jgi:hypothetical protein
VSGLTRRGFVGATTALSFIGGLTGVRVAAATPSLPAGTLLYDPTLVAGRRFAAHAGSFGKGATALEGDRVRLIRTMLAAGPEALWGVTRHADQLLVADIAREAGYRPVAVIQHCTDGRLVPQCSAGAQSIGTLAQYSGERWPAVFAELAAGGAPRAEVSAVTGRADPAMSWVLARRG